MASKENRKTIDYGPKTLREEGSVKSLWSRVLGLEWQKLLQ